MLLTAFIVSRLCHGCGKPSEIIVPLTTKTWYIEGSQKVKNLVLDMRVEYRESNDLMAHFLHAEMKLCWCKKSNRSN